SRFARGSDGLSVLGARGNIDGGLETRVDPPDPAAAGGAADRPDQRNRPAQSRFESRQRRQGAGQNLDRPRLVNLELCARSGVHLMVAVHLSGDDHQPVWPFAQLENVSAPLQVSRVSIEPVDDPRLSCEFRAARGTLAGTIVPGALVGGCRIRGLVLFFGV